METYFVVLLDPELSDKVRMEIRNKRKLGFQWKK